MAIPILHTIPDVTGMQDEAARKIDKAMKKAIKG
jgi:hypothetical protein